MDLSGASEWIHTTAADVQRAIDGLDKNDFEKWVKRICEGIGLQALLDDLQAVKLEKLPADIIHYIQDHPSQIVFYVAMGIVFFAPIVFYGLILSAAGFGAAGVGAGTSY